MATEVPMEDIPDCQFKNCNPDKHPAEYDFKMAAGPWSYGCEAAWTTRRAYPGLGTGKGQRLVKPKDGGA